MQITSMLPPNIRVLASALTSDEKPEPTLITRLGLNRHTAPNKTPHPAPAAVPIVAPAVNPLAWFGQHLPDAGCLPLRRALVLGCNADHLERELYGLCWAREIVAFDLSPKVLDAAPKSAAGMDTIRYVLASMDELPVEQAPFLPGSFDVVLGCVQRSPLLAAGQSVLGRGKAPHA